jgi:hypothetical protein
LTQPSQQRRITFPTTCYLSETGPFDLAGGLTAGRLIVSLGQSHRTSRADAAPARRRVSMGTIDLAEMVVPAAVVVVVLE